MGSKSTNFIVKGFNWYYARKGYFLPWASLKKVKIGFLPSARVVEIFMLALSSRGLPPLSTVDMAGSSCSATQSR